MKIYFCLVALLATTAASGNEILFQDNFDRKEANPKKQDIGNGWSSNTSLRSKNKKALGISDGAMHIKVPKGLDHSIIARHNVDFGDVLVEMKFKFTKGSDLSIDFGDENLKTVKAGRVCLAHIKPDGVALVDNMTVKMRLENIPRRGKPELQKLIAETETWIPFETKANTWHHVAVQTKGTTMTVTIDRKKVGEFDSKGMAHPTKSQLRLKTRREVWIDDLKVTDLTKP